MTTTPLAHSDPQELLALLSHELRNPLTVILANASYLLREEHDNSRLLEIREGVERVVSILDGFLAGDELEEPIWMAAVFLELQRSFSLTSGREVRLHLEDSLPPALVCPIQLDEVLQNLLSNADKYSCPSGSIEISVSNHHGWLLVSVGDDGPALPYRQREQIFQPGLRLSATSDRPGQGLGLAFCRRVVEGWQGRIWCESAQSGGNLFRFTMPVCKVDE